MYMFFILIFCLFCSQLTVLFTHFSARCKILFWVDTPWKSLCRSISTWYTGHNLNMGEQLYTILCLLLCAISYFLLYLLTVYRPEYSLYISSYVMLWPEWKIKRFVLYCIVQMMNLGWPWPFLRQGQVWFVMHNSFFNNCLSGNHNTWEKC